MCCVCMCVHVCVLLCVCGRMEVSVIIYVRTQHTRRFCEVNKNRTGKHLEYDHPAMVACREMINSLESKGCHPR